MSDLYLIAEKITALQQTVDKIDTTTVEIKEKQAVHNHILEEHHKRSTMLEQQMQPLREEFIFKQRLKASTLKYLGALGLLLGIIGALLKLLGKH